MTTGRINQVTVRHAPARARDRLLRGLPRLAGQSSSPELNSVRPPPGRRHGLSVVNQRLSVKAPGTVPSPPISQASATGPRTGGPRVGHLGEGYRANGRDAGSLHGTRRTSKSLSGLRFGQRQSTHIPLHRSQQPQKGSARLHSDPGKAARATHSDQAKSHPRRVHLAGRAHQPPGPGTASHPQT